MQATVAVCTHNRAALLPALVEALRRQACDDGFEILLIDSGSTDDTPRVLASLQTDRLPAVRTRRVERPGLCAARNEALALAAGAVVAFLDDDALPRSGWLRALLAPFADPQVGAVGGRIALRFEGASPPWLTASLHGLLTAYDLEPAPRAIRYRRTSGRGKR